MNAIRRLAAWRVSSDSTALAVVQMACFLVAPFVLALAMIVTQRWATTPGEILLGLLGGSALAVQFVLLGMVVPLGGKTAE